MFTQLARIKQSVAYQSKQLAHQEKQVDEMTRRRQEREVHLPFFIRKVSKKVDPLNILTKRNRQAERE